MALKRAKRQKLRGAIALIGASGSGKTLGALLVAYGMMQEKYKGTDIDPWEKIGLVDTEHERSLVYEGMKHQGVRIGQFWHYDLKVPYTVERYANAFSELKEQGVEVIIVDSTSHAWEGEGGILDYQQQLGGRFQDWNEANKKAFAPLVRLFTGEMHDLHVLNTIRAKQEYAMQPSETGKMEVVKLGVKPVQRDSFEYEFQVVFNILMDHTARVSKDNSGLFEHLNTSLTPEHGKQLYDWLEAGVDIFAEREAEEAKREEERQVLVQDIRRIAAEHGLEEWVAKMENHAAINKPVEELDHNTATRFYQSLLKEVDKTQGGN